MDESERWPAHLVRALRAATIDVGEPEYIARTAWTTDELMDAIASEKPKGPYDLVTLLVGVNDQYRARSLKSFAVEFKPVLLRAVQLAGGKPKRTVVLSIPDWGATPYAGGKDAEEITRAIEAYNAHAQQVTTERGAAWVDITGITRRMLKDPALCAEDGLHPSGAMYREWAELALPAAAKALGGRTS